MFRFFSLLFCTFLLFPEKSTYLDFVSVLSDEDEEILNSLVYGTTSNLALENLKFFDFIQEKSSVKRGYIDNLETFKVLLQKNCFKLFKINPERYLGKIRYPHCSIPYGITVNQDGKTFSASFNVGNKKNFYIWRQKNVKAYQRLFLGNFTAGVVSGDGEVAYTYCNNKETLYHWQWNGKEYVIRSQVLVGELGDNTTLSVSNDGQRGILIVKQKYEDNWTSPILIFNIKNGQVEVPKRFELPAIKASADISADGTQLALGYTLRPGFASDNTPKFHLVLLEISNLEKLPDLLAFLEIDQNIDRVEIEYNGKEILLGNGDEYSLFKLKKFESVEKLLENVNKYMGYSFLT